MTSSASVGSDGTDGTEQTDPVSAARAAVLGVYRQPNVTDQLDYELLYGDLDGTGLADYDDSILASEMVYPATQWQNVAVLAVVLLVALVVNFLALPVILFRRTKFGNGLFAVLILCLTVSDLAVTFFSVLGSLIVESSHFVWGGAPGSCQVRRRQVTFSVHKSECRHRAVALFKFRP